MKAKMMKLVVCVTSRESGETGTALLWEVRSWKYPLSTTWGSHATGYADSTCLRNAKGGSSKYLTKLFYFHFYSFHRGTEVVVLFACLFFYQEAFIFTKNCSELNLLYHSGTSDTSD